MTSKELLRGEAAVGGSAPGELRQGSTPDPVQIPFGASAAQESLRSHETPPHPSPLPRGGGEGVAKQLVARLLRHRKRQPGRAWVIGLVGPGAEAVLDKVRDEGERVVVVDDLDSARQASHERDLWMGRPQVVALVARDAEGWSRLGRVAPDLTTAMDGVFEV